MSSNPGTGWKGFYAILFQKLNTIIAKKLEIVFLFLLVKLFVDKYKKLLEIESIDVEGSSYYNIEFVEVRKYYNYSCHNKNMEYSLNNIPLMTIGSLNLGLRHQQVLPCA